MFSKWVIKPRNSNRQPICDKKNKSWKLTHVLELADKGGWITIKSVFHIFKSKVETRNLWKKPLEIQTVMYKKTNTVGIWHKACRSIGRWTWRHIIETNQVKYKEKIKQKHEQERKKTLVSYRTSKVTKLMFWDSLEER